MKGQTHSSDQHIKDAPPLERELGLSLSSLLDISEEIFVKKLALNDRDWARLENKHQGGVYIPPTERDSGFFPRLNTKLRAEPNAADIREAFFEIEWIDFAETREARLVNYTSKGPETHLTRIPKPAFKYLGPASLLVIGRNAGQYRGLTLDSEGEDCILLSDILSLKPEFRSGIFSMTEVKREREERTFTFVEEVAKAFFDGSIDSLTSKYANMPATIEIASEARRRYMQENGLASLNPFEMNSPGDAIMAISRVVEYEIFRDRQMKARALELVRLILGVDPKTISVDKALRSLVREFPKIDAILLSAAQQRKSRAGYSFEHHIEAMLIDGGVPFQKQVVIEAKKRPDFILPSYALYNETQRTNKEALVLSAKTTLRERWKQVGGEKRNCDLYLATVDENIAGNAIEDMASQGIRLVVPETLKSTDTSDYKKQSNVISFRQFFENEIGDTRWNLWQARGLVKKKGKSE